MKTQELVDKNIPEFSVYLELEKVESCLAKEQFQQVMILLDYFSEYLQKAKKEQEKLKYKYLRPLKKFSFLKGNERRENIKKWWTFAKNSIVLNKKESIWFVRVFGMGAAQKKEYENLFIPLY